MANQACLSKHLAGYAKLASLILILTVARQFQAIMPYKGFQKAFEKACGLVLTCFDRPTEAPGVLFEKL